MIVDSARCPRCKRRRPLAEFMMRRGRRSDRSPLCSTCRAEIRTARSRWGAGLVCDCEPAVILACGECTTCARPVVARMAPHLRERMARLRPQSVAQTVVYAAPAEAVTA